MIQICFQFMYIECRCEGSLVTGPTARDDPVWLVKAKRERPGSRLPPSLKIQVFVDKLRHSFDI
jgi:hypothetical protein